MKKRHILSFLVSLSYFCISFSQTNYRFENITTQQGLYFDQVRGIVQDKNGFMWFATVYGLNRYDGYTLTDYTYKAGDDKTLKESIVTHVFLDKDKNLWIQGDNLNMYDSKTEKFIQYKSSLKIYNYALDVNGNILTNFNFDREIIQIFNIKTKKYHDLKIETTDNSKAYILSQVIDHDNNIWIHSSEIIDLGHDAVIYKGSLNDFYKTNKLVIKPVITGKLVMSNICCDQKGNIWIVCDKKLQYYDMSKEQFIDFLPLPINESSKVYYFYFDSKDRLWIGFGTFTDLLCIDIKAKNIQAIKTDIRGKGRFYAGSIYSIFEDSFGVLWIGTGLNGVYKTNLNIKKFEYYSTDQGLADNDIQSIFEDSKGIKYFGSYKGLTHIHPDGNVNTFKNDEVKLPHFLSGNTCNSFCELPGNYIVAGGTGLCLSKFNNNEYFYLIPDNTDSSLTGWATWDIHKGQKSGHYWISNLFGFNEISDFNIINAKPGIVKQICPKIKQFNQNNFGEKLDLFWSSYEDKYGIVWLCSSDGLFRYDPVTNKFKHFSPDKNNPNALQARDVNSCCEDSKGRLWFATLGGGLSRFDRESEKFYNITKDDGLPSNQLYGVLADSKDNLWISSNKGLCKYNPDNRKVNYYNETDGVQGDVFNQRAFYKTPKGKMYFGGKNGVTAFYPDSIIDNPIPPKVVLTKLFINNKPVEVGEHVNGDIILKQSLIESKEIVLSHRNKVFAIEFSGLQTVAPEKIEYKYKMEGFDPEWINTDAMHRRALYSNLSAGIYVFKVKACNSDGMWNIEDRSIIIKVIPPFYKTWWFITLCILFIISMVAYYIQYRERKLRKEKQVLERKVEERTATINKQKEELTEKNKDITDSIRYARRIQKALLPQNIMKERKDILIYFRPKDIVSGDFYWLASAAGKEFIAAVDCTGHGVPGAFMSIIGTSILNKIVKEYKIYKPSEMLFMLNSELHSTLKSYSADDEVKDGMDLSLIAIDTSLNKIEYAGAMNSIYLVHNGQLTEFKADRNSIGKNTDSSVQFTNHEIEVQTGDLIYLFSDGFEDQFGGPDGKKYKASRMKELLTSISSLEMQEQYNKLNTAFEEWLGKLEQIDDVLVMGRKV
jgi:ligand-binding sensor domain-containing protein/serine phosphatase RsbU (regulator of sigma subunit)